uniref:BCS1 N-terminal domain-containing protein n=1 Tax=Ditylenchus dipsaci TaxID=166011 RepID=A0A915E020_9BILA
MNAAQECLGISLSSSNMHSTSHSSLVSNDGDSTHLFSNLGLVFFGSIMLSILGLIGYYLQSAYSTVHTAIWDRMVRTLEITNENIEYEWIMEHINKHSKWQTTNLSLNSKIEYDDHGKSFLDRRFLLGQGTHYFYFKGQWIQVTRTVENNKKNSKSEIVTLSTYGIYIRSDFWKNFLNEASEKQLDAMERGCPSTLFVMMSGTDGVKEALTEDLRDFLYSADWYNKMGVPYRRGYLLYGPPGTGKTSFIAALASHFGFNICIMSLSDPLMTDADLSRLLNTPPTRSFLLLEDIDAAFTKRDKDSKKKKKRKKTQKEEEEQDCSSDYDEECRRCTAVSTIRLMNNTVRVF